MKMIGVILAGGKSTRMRQDKALLKINGISLLERQFRLLEGILGKGNVIVSGDRLDYPHIRDVVTNIGPLGGLKSVCEYLLSKGSSSAVLVIPVDMPFVTESGLLQLIEQNSDTEIIKFKDQQFPFVIRDLFAVSKAIDEMVNNRRTSSAKNSCSLHGLFSKVKVEEIVAEPDILFSNMNTPEDWDAAIS